MDTMHETDIWQFVKARYFTKSSTRRDVTVIVIYSIDAPEIRNTESCVATHLAGVVRCIDFQLGGLAWSLSHNNPTLGRHAQRSFAKLEKRK